jgi:hypothetical protein
MIRVERSIEVEMCFDEYCVFQIVTGEGVTAKSYAKKSKSDEDCMPGDALSMCSVLNEVVESKSNRSGISSCF